MNIAVIHLEVKLLNASYCIYIKYIKSNVLKLMIICNSQRVKTLIGELF